MYTTISIFIMIFELIINDRTLLWLHMIFSNAIPYVPTHVGELINDELVASGLSVEQLSEKANIELIALNETISGKRQLSTEMALQIESVMGIPASLLLNIQIQYNSFLRRK